MSRPKFPFSLCLVVMHGHSFQMQHKAMEKKSQYFIFVVYCEDVKGYHLFDLVTREVHLFHDVYFHESFTSMDLTPQASSSLLLSSSFDDVLLPKDDDFDALDDVVLKDGIVLAVDITSSFSSPPPGPNISLPLHPYA